MKPKSRHPRPYMAGTLSINQLARRWAVSGKDVRRLLRERALQFEEIAGCIRMPLSEVERYEKSVGIRQS